MRYLGLGHDRVIRIATDDAGRMQVAALSRALESCDGLLIVIAQAGQINTGAFDPFQKIVDIVPLHGGGFMSMERLGYGPEPVPC
ncbi:hypothetical protein [Cupriavidus sp. TMH.W2]|uniref:hypothetical protein n=1 Tax=Cupriavidus sp. TMH.W2 TaxID=3434465 RepID=UPI003D77313B